jgi:hypothetical protein
MLIAALIGCFSAGLMCGTLAVWIITAPPELSSGAAAQVPGEGP